MIRKPPVLSAFGTRATILLSLIWGICCYRKTQFFSIRSLRALAPLEISPQEQPELGGDNKMASDFFRCVDGTAKSDDLLSSRDSVCPCRNFVVLVTRIVVDFCNCFGCHSGALWTGFWFYDVAPSSLCSRSVRVVVLSSQGSHNSIQCKLTGAGVSTVFLLIHFCTCDQSA